MNKIKYIIGFSLLTAISAMGQTQKFGSEQFNQWAGGGTAVNLGTNYTIIPAQSVNGQAPVVKGLSCRVLLTGGATLQSYFSTNQTAITLTNRVGQETTNFVSSTNGFTGGQAVVIQHLKLPPRLQTEYLLVSTTKDTNMLVYQTAPVSPIQVGDIINGQTAGASIAVVNSGTTSTTITTPMFAGQNGEPLLITLQAAGSASATNTIDAVYAEFPRAP